MTPKAEIPRGFAAKMESPPDVDLQHGDPVGCDDDGRIVPFASEENVAREPIGLFVEYADEPGFVRVFPTGG